MNGVREPRGAAARAFSAGEEALLRGAGRPKEWPAGAVVLVEGGPPEGVVLIHEGLVKTTADTPGGYTSLLAVRGPGELVGELSCLDRRPRSATVMAVRPVRGTVIAADRFLRLLEQHDALALSLVRSITGRLRASDRLRADQGALPAQARVARVLLDLALHHGAGVPRAPGARVVALSQSEVASASGTSRESVVRALRQLQRDGVVSTARGRITVHDLRALAHWTDPPGARTPHRRPGAPAGRCHR
ncbi:Crp/Fnr family transcriptional regulator [Actinacidiphila reveromycinica]|uniref:Crp/Fnr family transcriptional regulator n=1 Tax=Actinacidiphila reveromycinica TaxID=659352 RepID=UPI001F33A9CF|nr:Crp/Fnr family transcriptional regulator [Streptomyces sp. SN-593]